MPCASTSVDEKGAYQTSKDGRGCLRGVIFTEIRHETIFPFFPIVLFVVGVLYDHLSCPRSERSSSKGARALTAMLTTLMGIILFTMGLAAVGYTG